MAGPSPASSSQPPVSPAARSDSGVPLFDDPRSECERFAMLDLWRVHLQQCPECGHAHASELSRGLAGRPERHIYEFVGGAGRGAVSEDLLCTLCGGVFQNPTRSPCGHHFCYHCVRTLLTRTAGRAACPMDGQTLTCFALRPGEQELLDRLEDLRVRCPVCREEIRKGDLHLHLQDPVNMVEEPRAYHEILRPFYMSCPLSNFTVGEFNGSSSIIRFYRQLGEQTLRRFVLATDAFLVLPDPKMGFQPHNEEDFQGICTVGGYFNAYWVHPRLRKETWWGRAEPTTEQDLGSAERGLDRLLSGQDCSEEPWHASSFVHTWSAVRKPSKPRYLCCLRDLRGEDLPMLEKFHQDVLRFLAEHYGADQERVQIFAHYPSSARYSTLHFHIIFAGTQSSQYERYAKKLDRPHQLSRQFPLSHIIECLRKNPDHFRQCTLRYFLGDKADLMDPISAFFKCSPHKYLQDFTFHWDPDAVAGSKAPLGDEEAATSASASGSPSREEKLVAGSSAVRRAAEVPEAVAIQLAELRLSMEGLRQALAELRTTMGEVVEGQRLEAAGARMVLAQLVGPAAAAAGLQRWAVSCLLAGALVGGLLAGLSVTSRRLGRWASAG